MVRIYRELRNVIGYAASLPACSERSPKSWSASSHGVGTERGYSGSVAWIVISLALAACSDTVQPLADGPISLGGRVELSFEPALNATGLFHDICFVLPPDYGADINTGQLVAATGERGTIAVRLQDEFGLWFEFDQLSLLGANGETFLCLDSASVVGRVSLRFVRAEVESSMTWSSPRAVWMSVEKR